VHDRSAVLIAGAAVVAAGAAGATAFALRKQIRAMTLEALAEAISTGRSLGQHRFGKKRRSLLGRLLPPMAVLTAVAAAAGAALFLMLPKLAPEVAAINKTTAPVDTEGDPKSPAVADGEEPSTHVTP